jgi:hypothetical protein
MFTSSNLLSAQVNVGHVASAALNVGHGASAAVSVLPQPCPPAHSAPPPPHQTNNCPPPPPPHQTNNCPPPDHSPPPSNCPPPHQANNCPPPDHSPPPSNCPPPDHGGGAQHAALVSADVNIGHFAGAELSLLGGHDLVDLHVGFPDCVSGLCGRVLRPRRTGPAPGPLLYPATPRAMHQPS